MKLITTILAALIITFSALPCDDVQVNAQQSASVSQEIDHGNDSHSDLCSPFCMCSCCSVSITEPLKHFMVNVGKPLKEVATFYNSSFTNNYYSKIYQPPQV
jgi:hypothetical protein